MRRHTPLAHQHATNACTNGKPMKPHTAAEVAKIGNVCALCNEFILNNFEEINRMLINTDIIAWAKTYHPDKDIRTALDILKQDIPTEVLKILKSKKRFRFVYTN